MFNDLFKIKEILARVKTEANARNSISAFYSTYFEQKKIIDEKLLICSNEINRNHILEYSNDLDKIKDEMDLVLFDLEKGNVKKLKTFYNIGKFINEIGKKYSHENCDIVNFKI